jgi:hypothetical protein
MRRAQRNLVLAPGDEALARQEPRDLAAHRSGSGACHGQRAAMKVIACR